MSSQQLTQLTSLMKEIDMELLQKEVRSTFGDVLTTMSTRPVRIRKQQNGIRTYECDGVIQLIKKGEDFYVGLSKEQVDELRKMYKAGKY
jgi:hypothetical protein